MPSVTQNMGLTRWDLGTDFYNHDQLSNNFKTIDDHDHTPSRGARLGTNSLQDGAITGPKLAPNSVTPDKILDNSITDAELAEDSVGNPELKSNSVGTAEIQNGSVTPEKLSEPSAPIGTVVAWYRPNNDVPLPTGAWTVCDGRTWLSTPNAWGLTTGTLPDLRGKFILGAATTNNGSGVDQFPSIGQVGGSHTKDLSHGHTVNAHSHTVAEHAHGIADEVNHNHIITPGGDHNHGMHSRTNALLQNIEVQSYLQPIGSTTEVRRRNTAQSLYVAGFNQTDPDPGTADQLIPSTGSHNHGGFTGDGGAHNHTGATVTTPASPTTDASPGTNSALTAATDIRPAYVGLIYIMKVL